MTTVEHCYFNCTECKNEYREKIPQWGKASCPKCGTHNDPDVLNQTFEYILVYTASQVANKKLIEDNFIQEFHKTMLAQNNFWYDVSSPMYMQQCYRAFEIRMGDQKRVLLTHFKNLYDAAVSRASS